MESRADVSDPFGVASDPAIPSLARALDPIEAQREFERGFPRLIGVKGRLHLRKIQVTRYKPGRRCLIEYEVEVARPNVPPEAITLVGKVRARGLDISTYDLLQVLWNAGFATDSPDGISVPEPIGVIPALQLWLCRKAPGVVATRLLAEPGGVAMTRRIAEALHKLHRAGIPSHRRHMMTDELRILRDRLGFVAQTKPQWIARLKKLLDACDRLGTALPVPRPAGIHRDFYPDHVIVDGPRLYLLDFDLYAEGDPGLDIGNFLGHLIEQSLRTLGHASALMGQANAMEERFVELAGENSRASVRAYTTLTLARHIYLSTQFPDRQHLTEILLDLCEERLGRATARESIS